MQRADRIPDAARWIWIAVLIAGVLEVVGGGALRVPLDQPGSHATCAESSGSDSSRPVGQVQSWASLDLAAPISVVELKLPAPSAFQPLAPSVLGRDRPGFRERILRPPRPIA